MDGEFGPIALRYNARAKYVRLRMQTDGRLVVTMPPYASERHAVNLVDQSRAAIRSWRAKHVNQPVLEDGQQIGQSHKLRILPSNLDQTTTRVTGLTLEVYLSPGKSAKDSDVQDLIATHVSKILQKEARAYLPRRLKYLAEAYGLSYKNVRFGTQKGRWGSCSTSGTISLNVGLMALDAELIDYVLTHELCHTRHMNHSASFWALVEQHMPDYKTRRQRLKSIVPTK